MKLRVFIAIILPNNLTYELSVGYYITASLVDNILTFSAVQDFYGTEDFTVTVSDGTLVDTQIVTVTVNAINDAPTLASVDTVIFAEDGSGGTTLLGDDVDGDNLTYEISDGINITAALVDNVLTFTPLPIMFFNKKITKHKLVSENQK